MTVDSRCVPLTIAALLLASPLVSSCDSAADPVADPTPDRELLMGGPGGDLERHPCGDARVDLSGAVTVQWSGRGVVEGLEQGFPSYVAEAGDVIVILGAIEKDPFLVVSTAAGEGYDINQNPPPPDAITFRGDGSGAQATVDARSLDGDVVHVAVGFDCEVPRTQQSD